MKPVHILNDICGNDANSRVRKCFALEGECSSPAIQAHSIPLQVLAPYAENREVVVIDRRLGESGATFDFRRRNIKRATVFTGLCATHDRDIFSSIDNNFFDLSDPRHLFLLVYRSVVKELHANHTAVKLLKSVLKNRRLGLMYPRYVDRMSVFAEAWADPLKSTTRYKQVLDAAFEHEAYDYLTHVEFEVGSDAPCIAVSALINPIGERVYHSLRNELFFVPPLLSLNLFWRENKHHAIFSFLDDDELKLRPFIDPFLMKSGEEKEMLLSKFILQHIENFALSPRVHRTAVEPIKEDILSFFGNNMYSVPHPIGDLRVNFFEPRSDAAIHPKRTLS